MEYRNVRSEDYEAEFWNKLLQLGPQHQTAVPQYIFARFRARDMLQKICFTRGVKRVVCFGDVLTPVADGIIGLIKLRSNKDGIVKVVEELLPGDRIIINHGHLKNFTEIFERHMKGQDRVAIMLDTINFQNWLVVESDWVRKAG